MKEPKPPDSEPKKWSLEYYRKKYGNFDATFAEKKESWSAWKKYDDWEPSERTFLNVRQIMKNEIVFDCEDEETKNIAIEGIKEAGFGYVLWFTGSRGYHIHTFFPQLNQVNDEDVLSELKAYYMAKFGSDIKMKEKRRLIAAEYQPHFKSGDPKTLIEEVGDPENNMLPFGVIAEVMSRLSSKAAATGTANTVLLPKHKKGASLYEHMKKLGLKSMLPQGSRNTTFLKNLAAAAVEYDPADADRIMTEVCVHQQMGANAGAGWLKKAKAGNLQFSPLEMLGYLKKSGLPMYRPPNLRQVNYTGMPLYRDDENQYWVYDGKSKQHELATNFVFERIPFKLVTRAMVYFEVEILLSHGEIITQKTSMEDISGEGKFRKWLLQLSAHLQLYGTKKRKLAVVDALFDYLREKILDERNIMQVQELDDSSMMVAVIQEGFVKNKIGIHGMQIPGVTPLAMPDYVIGKKPKASDDVVIYPEKLLAFLASNGMPMKTIKDLLPEVKKAFGVEYSRKQVRVGKKKVNGWAVPAIIFEEIISKGAEEDETPLDADREPVNVDKVETLSDKAKVAFEGVKKKIEDGETIDDEDEASRLFGLLETEGYFENNANSDVWKYLEDNGAVPF